MAEQVGAELSRARATARCYDELLMCHGDVCTGIHTCRGAYAQLALAAADDTSLYITVPSGLLDGEDYDEDLGGEPSRGNDGGTGAAGGGNGDGRGGGADGHAARARARLLQRAGGDK